MYYVLTWMFGNMKLFLGSNRISPSFSLLTYITSTTNKIDNLTCDYS